MRPEARAALRLTTRFDGARRPGATHFLPEIEVFEDDVSTEMTGLSPTARSDVGGEMFAISIASSGDPDRSVESPDLEHRRQARTIIQEGRGGDSARSWRCVWLLDSMVDVRVRLTFFRVEVLLV